MSHWNVCVGLATQSESRLSRPLYSPATPPSSGTVTHICTHRMIRHSTAQHQKPKRAPAKGPPCTLCWEDYKDVKYIVSSGAKAALTHNWDGAEHCVMGHALLAWYCSCL